MLLHLTVVSRFGGGQWQAIRRGHLAVVREGAGIADPDRLVHSTHPKMLHIGMGMWRFRLMGDGAGTGRGGGCGICYALHEGAIDFWGSKGRGLFQIFATIKHSESL